MPENKKHVILLALLLLAAAAVAAQTKISLRDQTRNFDFGDADSTRPVKTGTALPGACRQGELYFLTSALPGQNLYGCTDSAVWTALSGGSAAGGALTYSFAFSNQTQLTVTNAQHGLGTADLSVNCVDNATPAVELARASTTTHPTTYEVHITFASAFSGRCWLTAPGQPYLPGAGLIQNGVEWLVDPAVVPFFLSAEATLAEWEIEGQQCLERTLAATGAAVGDAVTPRWPIELPGNLVGMMLVSAPGQLTVRLCNVGSSTATVPAKSFGASVLKNF